MIWRRRPYVARGCVGVLCFTFFATGGEPAFAESTSAPRVDTIERAVAGMRAIESWRADEALSIVPELLRDDPTSPATLALLAELELHMSDYVGAVASYRRAREAGAPEVLLGNEALADAARIATDGYDESVSEHFIVRFKPGRDRILVSHAIDTLERALARLGDFFGWRPKMRIVLEIYPSAATLASVSTLTKREIENSGTIALCRWNRLMITTPRAVLFGYSWRDTISHELAHLIIGGASRNTAPIWLHEGLAKYVETAWNREPGLGISARQKAALASAAASKRLIPFERMHPSMAKLPSQEETSLAFSEVFTFIEYLVELRGPDGIRRVLSLMATGKSDSAAVLEVYGDSLGTLSNRWIARLEKSAASSIADVRGPGGQRKLVIKDRPDAPDDALHGLGKSARRFARAADLLYARGRLRAAQRELEKAHRESRSPIVAGKLAVVASAVGDLVTAETAAREAIAGTPDMASPYVTLAEILVRLDRKSEARAALESAIGINPFDPRIFALMLAMDRDSLTDHERALARTHLQILEGHGSSERATAGVGGLVQIEGLPLHRIYLSRRGGRDPTIPTGRTTPTSPIEARPGIFDIELVPPLGASRKRVLEVLPTPSDGSAQRFDATDAGS